MRLLRILCASLFMCAVSSSAFAAPILLIDGIWDTFSWEDGLGAIDFPADGYTYTSATPFTLRVVDCCIIGDEFEVHVTGDATIDFDTSVVLPSDEGIQSGAFDGDAAWADLRLSRGSVLLAPGTYSFGIDVTSIDSGSFTGDGFIRADTALSEIPEPATLLLLGSGLLVVARRRRRSA